MESHEINTFHKDISNQLDNGDLSLEKIIELLRNKMIDLSEAHLSSRNMFRKTKNNKSVKLKTCPWFDAECQENKQLLNNKRKKYQAALKLYSNNHNNQVTDLKAAYFQQ